MKNKKEENKNKEEEIINQEENIASEPLNEIEENHSGVIIPESKLILIKNLLKNIQETNNQLVNLLSIFIPPEEEVRIGLGQIGEEKFGDNEIGSGGEGGRVIEGVFDGESMIGPDGKKYSIPVNYASKSKLVEGDILKLTITSKGTFVYKQIGPIARDRIVGRLEKSKDGEYIVVKDGGSWRVLNSSITYFKGEAGDEVVILIPKTGESKWAAVENVIKYPNN